MHVSNKHKSLRSHLFFFPSTGYFDIHHPAQSPVGGLEHFFLHQNERKHEISQLQLTACQHERAQPPPPPPLPSSSDKCERSPLQEYDLFPLYYARLVSVLRKCPTNASGGLACLPVHTALVDLRVCSSRREIRRIGATSCQGAGVS